MNLTEHFTLEEMILSQTAARKGIDNTPSEEVVSNLRRLALRLEDVRAFLGRPLSISSGYRSAQLNKAIGGVANSAHIYGLAADFTCSAVGTPFEVARRIATSGIPYDQLIHEYNTWVHLAIGPLQRREDLSIFTAGGYIKGIVKEAA